VNYQPSPLLDSDEEKKPFGFLQTPLPINTRCVSHSNFLDKPLGFNNKRRVSQDVSGRLQPDRNAILKFMEYEDRIRKLEKEMGQLKSQNTNLHETVNFLLQMNL